MNKRLAWCSLASLILAFLVSLIGCAKDETSQIVPDTGVTATVVKPQVVFSGWIPINLNDYDKELSKEVEYAMDSSCGAVLRRWGPPDSDTTAAFRIPEGRPDSYKLTIEYRGLSFDLPILVNVNGQFVSMKGAEVKDAGTCGMPLQAVAGDVKLRGRQDILMISGNIPDIVSIEFTSRSAGKMTL